MCQVDTDILNTTHLFSKFLFFSISERAVNHLVEKKRWRRKSPGKLPILLFVLVTTAVVVASSAPTTRLVRVFGARLGAFFGEDFSRCVR